MVSPAHQRRIPESVQRSLRKTEIDPQRLALVQKLRGQQVKPFIPHEPRRNRVQPDRQSEQPHHQRKRRSVPLAFPRIRQRYGEEMVLSVFRQPVMIRQVPLTAGGLFDRANPTR